MVQQECQTTRTGQVQVRIQMDLTIVAGFIEKDDGFREKDIWFMISPTFSRRFCRLSNDHKYFQYDDFAEKDGETAPSLDRLALKFPVVDIKTFLTGKTWFPTQLSPTIIGR